MCDTYINFDKCDKNKTVVSNLALNFGENLFFGAEYSFSYDSDTISCLRTYTNVAGIEYLRYEIWTKNS